MKHSIINADCLNYLAEKTQSWDTIFADPPDNIGQKYKAHSDSLPSCLYETTMREWLWAFVSVSRTVWLSYNARHGFFVGNIVLSLLHRYPNLEAKQCVQTFTFGQHNHHDLGNNYRPLLRLRWKDAPLFPDAVRCQSERQKNGDKRADPRGRVPSDVFDFPRVTGNSKQRRKWHPTQLNEGLVERCLKLTTPEGGSVLDPFAGTGTTLRVCNRLGMDCTLIEIDPKYCALIAKEHNLKVNV